MISYENGIMPIYYCTDSSNLQQKWVYSEKPANVEVLQYFMISE